MAIGIENQAQAGPCFAGTSPLGCTPSKNGRMQYIFKQRDRPFCIAPTEDDSPGQPELGVLCSVLIRGPLRRFCDAQGSPSREGCVQETCENLPNWSIYDPDPPTLVATASPLYSLGVLGYSCRWICSCEKSPPWTQTTYCLLCLFSLSY